MTIVNVLPWFSSLVNLDKSDKSGTQAYAIDNPIIIPTKINRKYIANVGWAKKSSIAILKPEPNFCVV